MFRITRKFRTEKARQRHRKRVMEDASVIGVGLLMVALGCVAALHSPYLRIAKVTVTGAGDADARAVTEAAQRAIEGSALGIVPRGSSLFFHDGRVEAAVLRAVPKMKAAAASHDGVRGMAIAVVERAPKALWCGDVVPDHSALMAGAFAEHCYFIDETGFIYERAPSITGPAYPRFWGAIAQGAPEGSQFLQSREFEALTHFMRDLHESGVSPLGILLIDEEEMELYDSGGMRMLLLRTDDLARLARSIKAVRDSGILAGKDAAIEYVDMRFGDRVYFKPLAARQPQSAAVVPEAAEAEAAAEAVAGEPAE